MADSTLAAIRLKVRRLTRSPSEQQLSTADIDEYVNTFILYDFPQELRLSSFRKSFTFYTDPGTDLYLTNSLGNAPLTNFRNLYNAVHTPIYVGGYQAYLSQSEKEFYDLYPFANTVTQEATGDGVSVAFTGTISSVPLLKNKVTFTSLDVNGLGLYLVDDGADGPTGTLDGDGSGTINYETGAFTLLWSTAPETSEPIYSNTVPYTAARPDTVLYFDSNFIVRPVPDKVYPIQIEVDMRPSEILASNVSPDLEQWWQYIAYGASKKVLEDRTDPESVAEIMPEFKNQEKLVLRRTIINQSKERSSTIYVDALNPGYGSNYRK